MDSPSPTTRDLARRLVAREAAEPARADSHVHESLRVVEKLRVSLTRFAGADGFAALLRRALALARAEHPLLHSVTEKSDGSLEGLNELPATSRDDASEAAITITAYLIELLATFIGDSLTMRLVREDWPDALRGE